LTNLFSKINKYSFQGAQPSYGATVSSHLLKPLNTNHPASLNAQITTFAHSTISTYSSCHKPIDWESLINIQLMLQETTFLTSQVTTSLIDRQPPSLYIAFESL
jgi:hypothetical protein